MSDGTKDEIEGKLHEVKGKVVEATGKLIENPDVEADGRHEKREGEAQQLMGRLARFLDS